ncbi:hypothetical protein ACIRFF_08720 [Streptomyces cyaneofuscatus]
MTTTHSSAARTAAEALAAQGEHVHYISEGQAQCLSGACTTVVGP